MSFGLISDVCKLQGERFGYMLGGPPAHSVEERRKTVSSPQPGPFPEIGGEGRTLIFMSLALKKVGKLMLNGVHK